jgi:hypothetical protein
MKRAASPFTDARFGCPSRNPTLFKRMAGAPDATPPHAAKTATIRMRLNVMRLVMILAAFGGSRDNANSWLICRRLYWNYHFHRRKFHIEFTGQLC